MHTERIFNYLGRPVLTIIMSQKIHTHQLTKRKLTEEK